ncbi:MAG: guanylate kinase [Nitrospiraceae bacterium]|nr:guanylate kinase [Nitrospiraceae bacterium]
MSPLDFSGGGAGDIFIISAPSGAGKTTLCDRLIAELPRLRHSVSYTTRNPRPGEVDGVHYNFVPEAEFKAMVERDEFVEWAVVHGNYYGTSAEGLREMTASGADVVLDIDTQGAKQMKGKFPEAVYIFILPPSMKTLRQRLEDRKSDSPDVIVRRLKNAVDEIRDYYLYDYVIINDVLEEALERLKAVILAQRVSASRVDPAWIEEQFFKEVQG